MHKLVQAAALAALATVTSFGLVGCKKATGGGGLTDADGNRITFGLQLRCANEGVPSGQVPPDAYVGRITGQFQFRDHTQGIAFHGDMDSLATDIDATNGGSCEEMAAAAADQSGQQIFAAEGSYTPQPKNQGEGGQVQVVVFGDDTSGTTGCAPGTDALQVALIGGVFDGHETLGCLDRGNITVFTE